MNRRTPRIVALAGLTAALAVGACGGDDGQREVKGTATEPATAGPSGTALDVEAHDISFTPKELQATAGDVTIRYTNSGAIQHTLLIEGVDGFKLDVTKSGDADTGTVNLAPGAYTMYCDVPGHRAAGMEGRLVVS
jgi:plastocyanin